ncbi:hypothetical protein MRB53_040940 [Persea americana]|nr:hypothetical protein MRB53_040940 [Persea americana]
MPPESTMSTPTEPFSNLSLSDPRLPPTPLSPYASQYSPMAPASTVRERALVMQDILSSFDAQALPSEMRPSIFDNIVQNMDAPLANRPTSGEWTIQNDLQGTILQRASYDGRFWDVLCDLQPADTCAVIFREKIKARLQQCLTAYDEFVASSPISVTLVGQTIKEIAGRFWKYSDILELDRERRQYEEVSETVESGTIATLLDILEAICHRDQPIVVMRQTRGRSSSANDSQLTLFRLLISDDDDDDVEGRTFLLGSLERFAGAPLKINRTKLVFVGDLLEEAYAPADYIERFRKIRDKANDPLQQAAPSGFSGRRSGLEADPRPGSKRPQGRLGESPLTPKRGRKGEDA